MEPRARAAAVCTRLAECHHRAAAGAARLAWALLVFGGGLLLVGALVDGPWRDAALALGFVALALTLLPWHLRLEHREREAGLRTLAEEWAELLRADPGHEARIVTMLQRAYGHRRVGREGR